MNRNSTVEYLDRLAGVWADWALASSWQIALLVLLVTLVALASRRLSARFRYLLWMLVLIKALTPPTLGAFWSIGNWAGPDLWQHSRATVSSHFDTPESPAVVFSSQPVDAMDTGGVEPPLQVRAIDRPVNATNTPAWSVRAVALAVWLAGFAMFTLFIAVRYWRLTHALKRAAVVDEGPLRVALERLAMRLGWGDPPELLLSGAVGSPFLFGLLRPRIVLPESLPETLEPGRLEDVLLHELTHWRRRDLAASWLQILVQALFWFHPLVWLAGVQLRHERECACDEAVLASGCSQARRYGESLLSVLMAARGRSSAVLGFLGIFERNTRMQRRLEEIMNQENKVRRLGVGGWLALALFAALCLPMAAVENVKALPKSGTAGTLSALRFDGQHDYLEVADSPALELAPSTIIEGWIKIRKAYGETAILSKEVPGKSGYSLIVAGSPKSRAGALDLVFAIGYGERFVNLAAPEVISHDQWTHVMAIYGQEKNELWVNFKEVASQQHIHKDVTAPGVPLRIGRGSANLKRYFDGEIASLRIWRMDFPNHRDVNYYRFPLDGDEPGLVACWDFFQGDGELKDKGPAKLKTVAGKGGNPEPVALTGLEFKPKSESHFYGTGPQWERPFVNDPDALGHWTAVDFVRDIGQFAPGKKQWPGDLFIKDFEFLPDGKTKHYSWQSWTRGWLWRSGDKAEGKYEIRTIDGRPYLFMEWISGDVTHRGMKPQYYVFAREVTPGAEIGATPAGAESPFAANLLKDVSVNIDKSPDGGKLSVQYGVAAICEAAGIPYQFDKSGQEADPERRQFIAPVDIKDTPADQALSDVLLPTGLAFRLDDNGLYLVKQEKVTFDLNRGQQRTFHNTRFSLVRVEGGNKDDLHDDTAELEVVTANEVIKLAIQELDTQIVGAYEIKVDDVVPSWPGDGSVRITIRYAPGLVTHSESKPQMDTSDPIVGRWRGEGSGDGTVVTFGPDQRWWMGDKSGADDNGRWARDGDGYLLEGLIDGHVLAFDITLEGHRLTFTSVTEPDEHFAFVRVSGEKSDVSSGVGASSPPEGAWMLTYAGKDATGKRSIAGGGHAVVYTQLLDTARADAKNYVEAVEIFAARYGTPEPPADQFHLFVLDEEARVLADIPFPYAMIERGDRRWHTLRTPSIEVPQKFMIGLAFNSHQTKGIFLGIDGNAPTRNSLTGLPDEGYEKFEEGEWMVRVAMNAEPSGKRGIMRLADAKPSPGDALVDPARKTSCGKWFLAGSRPQSYDLICGDDDPQGAKGCALRSNDAPVQGFGTVMAEMPAESYRGKRVRMSAVVETRDVPIRAAMWMRVDGVDGKSLSFDNMGKRPIRGTVENQTCEIVLDVPQESEKIAYGLLLAGTGYARIGNVKFEAVGADVPVTIDMEKTSAPPRIVATSPEVGATGVDPATTEITVTFDRDMGGGMSWTGGGADFPPAPEGARATWIDKRTCVRPVKLEAGRYYRIGINSTSYQNFASAEGVPARPSAIYFCTTGASPELEAKVIKPRIVAMEPPNGATDVDPGLTELRVTFSVPMGGGFSWTGGGPQYPEGREGERPHWSEDGRTCIRPVSLAPGKIYRLGLNSPSHKNFASSGGVPLDPVVYTFQTRQ